MSPTDYTVKTLELKLKVRSLDKINLSNTDWYKVALCCTQSEKIASQEDINQICALPRKNVLRTWLPVRII